MANEPDEVLKGKRIRTTAKDVGMPDLDLKKVPDNISGKEPDSLRNKKQDLSAVAKIAKEVDLLSEKNLKRILTNVLNRLLKAEDKIQKLEARIVGIHKASK